MRVDNGELRRRAAEQGVSVSYWDWEGREVVVPDKTLAAIVTVLEDAGLEDARVEGALAANSSSAAPEAVAATPGERSWGFAVQLYSLRSENSWGFGDLRDLVEPQDNELYEKALQTAFTGTDLPITLARKKVEVLVLTGIHLDWCIEGNARAARDHGLLPIVIGDATGCQRPDQEPAAFERINNYFAPVISSDTFVDLLKG